MRAASALVLCGGLLVGCGGAAPRPGSESGEKPRLVEETTPGTVSRGDASTDLDTTPISAADYQMYAAIMGGASALLATISDADRHALELAKKIEAGAEKVTPGTEPLLSRARALKQQDLELARMQGIEPRYRKVKEKIEAVIGPDAKVPAPNDTVAQENLRYLEAHRATIERLQKILRDPLSRPVPQPAAQ